ncbi:MAG: hypothetical protein HRT49_12940 [Cognatishimia sp.]|nr:hypothetical protein [Cognatishimia sp.]
MPSKFQNAQNMGEYPNILLTQRKSAYDNLTRSHGTSAAMRDQTCCRGKQKEGLTMLDNAKKAIGALTEIGIALLALAIVASLLVGPSNMAFLGDVVGNITALVSQLGSAGLAGLISLGVVLWLFRG